MLKTRGAPPFSSVLYVNMCLYTKTHIYHTTKITKINRNTQQSYSPILLLLPQGEQLLLQAYIFNFTLQIPDATFRSKIVSGILDNHFSLKFVLP